MSISSTTLTSRSSQVARSEFLIRWRCAGCRQHLYYPLASQLSNPCACIYPRDHVPTRFSATLPEPPRQETPLTLASLSAGQKQLIVLARALLRQQKILIMDEATASIDSATDAEISRVVHKEFIGATVLIIAHRLRVRAFCLSRTSNHSRTPVADRTDHHALLQDSRDGQGEPCSTRFAVRVDWRGWRTIPGAVQGGRSRRVPTPALVGRAGEKEDAARRYRLNESDAVITA